MGLYQILPEEIREVDVIIAGGGTAGCVVASRLAVADPELSILVLESGQDNHNVPQIRHPALLRTNMVSDSSKLLHYTSSEEKNLANRRIWTPAGGTLGGGSSVNGMLYTRAQRSDYDSWQTPGWSSKELEFYLKKLETYHGQGADEIHGYDGPLHVSRSTYRSSLGEDFVGAMRATGTPEVEDLQDLQTGDGVARALAWVSPTDGRRQDVAHRYLHPLLQNGKHPNLHVLVEAQVLRVLFNDEKCATGVEYRPNPLFQTEEARPRIVKARRMVILSAGAHGTPLILERSGVGDPDILHRAHVPSVLPLPGVGRNFQDHQLLFCYYKSSASPGETLDSVYNGDIPGLIAKDDEILRWNGFDASSKIRPTDRELDRLGKDFREAWREDLEKDKTRPLTSFLFYSGVLGDPTGLAPGQYFTICTYTAYPYSRGHIHITGPEVDDPLDFVTGYLSDGNGLDIKTHIWAYKKQREVARRMRLYQGVVAERHPQFPEGSQAVQDPAATGDETTHPATGANLDYSLEDDAAIETWVRENVQVCWHFLGTCKMAPVDQMGAVDESLSVHGLKGLKVADMSIVPKMVSANTYNTAVMIGEKAADILIQDLGLA